MRRTVLLVALASLLALGGQSFAELCTIDAVPAATLLLPYFEVGLTPTDDDDVASTTNVDTFFSVNNASAAPTVAHVVFWGDWSLPSIDFDIFLTGYDVETVSLADVFNNGNLPVTAHAWNDPEDTISPHGQDSQNPAWDSFSPNVMTSGPNAGEDQGCDPQNDIPGTDGYCPRLGGDPLAPFTGCDVNLPLGRPALSGQFLDRVRCGHTGRGLACEAEECIGTPHGDGGNDYIARGYITIDNVRDCNLFFPNSSSSYFAGANAYVTNVNQLWGDWFIVQDGRAIGDNLVAIEAWNDRQYPGQMFAPDAYTFYGRYQLPVGASAADQREPLASTWATRYFNTAGNPAAAFDGGTSLMVWRDSKCQLAGVSAYTTAGAGCVANADAPPWYPLDETQVVAFDLQEDATVICGPAGGTAGQGGVSPPIEGTDPDETQCFPLETGRYRVGEGNLDPPYDFGWMYLNLNFTLGDTSAKDPPCTTTGLFGNIAQSWVNTELDAIGGQYSVGFAGTQLTSACAVGPVGSPADPIIRVPAPNPP